MKNNNIIELKGKVTEAKLDTCLVISSIAYQPTTNKLAVGLHKSMKTKEGLLYGEAFAGNVNISIEDLEVNNEAVKGLFDLIKKAELKFRLSDNKEGALKISAKDL